MRQVISKYISANVRAAWLPEFVTITGTCLTMTRLVNYLVGKKKDLYVKGTSLACPSTLQLTAKLLPVDSFLVKVSSLQALNKQMCHN